MEETRQRHSLSEENEAQYNHREEGGEELAERPELRASGREPIDILVDLAQIEGGL